MFHKARLRLTILYSIIFLVLFWTLSAGVYEWMNGHFGDAQRKDFDRYTYREQYSYEGFPLRESPSDIVMDELRDTLIILDIILLILVPTITWFLTKRTLAPVQEAHEREKRFFTDASHDLRTPLTILKGEVELALKKNQTKQAYIHTLQSNKEEIDDLISLVENMMFFARDDKKNQVLQKNEIDLTDVLAEKFAVFQKVARHKKIAFSFIPPKEEVIVLGNRQLLKRLFSSLFDNAVKYTAQKGKITVKLMKEKTTAIVIISDTGIGIPKEEQGKIFDRFYRTESSRNKKGYGLGLSIVKKIMDFHNGSISLNSIVSKGTTFSLSFPILIQTQEKSQS